MSRKKHDEDLRKSLFGTLGATLGAARGGILTNLYAKKKHPSKVKLLTTLGGVIDGALGAYAGVQLANYLNKKRSLEDSKMNKTGLDRAYYKQKAKKSCKKGLDKVAAGPDPRRSYDNTKLDQVLDSMEYHKTTPKNRLSASDIKRKREETHNIFKKIRDTRNLGSNIIFSGTGGLLGLVSGLILGNKIVPPNMRKLQGLASMAGGISGSALGGTGGWKLSKGLNKRINNSEIKSIDADLDAWEKRVKGLDKKASTNSTGVSQLKQRKTTQHKKYTAEGTGLGAAGGGFAGYKLTKALGPKWNIPATLIGSAIGGLAGRHVGKKGSKTKTKYIEGVVKKQEKSKDSPAKLPQLNREKVRGLLAYNK